MKRFWSIPLMLMLFACQTPKESREELSLAGCWELQLDSTDVTEQVQLPGTTAPTKKDTLTMTRRRQLICLGPSAIKVRLGIRKRSRFQRIGKARAFG